MDEFYKNSLDALTQVARGAIYNASVVHRFGGAVVGTDYAPVTDLLAYRTPQVGAATALRIKAGGNAADSGRRLWGAFCEADGHRRIRRTDY
jgi:hypothetical protein